MPTTLLLALALGSAARAGLAPITSKPGAVALSPDDLTRLGAGKAVLRTSKGESGGTGVAVQDVAAPIDTVWDTILNYDKYPDWVDNVTACTIYRREGNRFWLDIQSTVMGLSTALYTINTVHRDQGWMAWKVDETKDNSVEDMIGYWRLEALQQSPPLTRVEYSTQITMSGVPGFVVRYLTNESLTDGTGWVKKRAEEAHSRGASR